jgi:hypothetical protein
MFIKIDYRKKEFRMGKNNQWNNYSNEDLIEMLRKVLENDNNVKAVDFSKLGLPSVKTYKNILDLPNVTMKSFYNYFSLEYNNPKYHCSGSPKEYTLDDMKNIAYVQGFVLLNESFNNTNEIAHLKCKACGELKDLKYKFFIYKPTRCLVCTDNPNRYTYEKIKNYIETESNSGCKLLETEETYREKILLQPQMSLCKIKIQCHCGEEFEESFNTFNGGTKKQECNLCTIGRKSSSYTYKDVKNYIEIESKSGCKLLSTEYTGYHDNLHIQCACGNDYFRSFSVFKGTINQEGVQKCKICTGAVITPTFTEVQKDLKEHNILLHETEYLNQDTKMNVEYDCGFKVYRTYANIKKSKYKCPHCIKIGYGRDTEQLKNEINDITNGEYSLLSEYKTMNDKVIVKHNKCGNVYKVTPHKFLDYGNRCVKCGNSKGETETERVLKKLNINYEWQYSFNDLLSDYGNPLRFDFAIFNKDKALSFLYEYDGEFHYKKIYTKHDLEGQVYRDNLKNEYCKQNKIDLLRIPYWDFDNIETILTDKLKQKGLI